MTESTDRTPRTWVVSTADVLRALPYTSPIVGWHAHGKSLIPTDGCAACAELRRRKNAAAIPKDDGGGEG